MQSGFAKSHSDPGTLMQLAAQVVTAFVGRNDLSADEVPALVKTVYAAMQDACAGGTTLAPAVAVSKSISNDEIICLECGVGLTMLKRHLRTVHGLAPAQYRQKWNLPADYPLTAPTYALARSKIAKNTGLGRVKKSPPSRTRKTRRK
ncbi:MAG: MucR family transcriptional regulator [Parvibaculum sp.]|nr:MucR family transcriptional regulator [Parvibaculum sp.]